MNDFVSGLLADAAERAGCYFDAEIVPLADGWPRALQDAAASRGIHRVATAHLPEGPARDEIKARWPGSLSLREIVRPYDRAVWPHAKAGFFGLKKEIPRLMKALLPADSE
ncbi:MAG: hypothetical protein B7Z22_08910 [Hyphomonas sp. 32-62-5]|nr:MAG: hypothetical protein B7Z22_08910 [Hyphomonas sp. 32-62-5]